ncbi:MAG: SAM-dependent methyltransferase [Nitrososphaerota archaeon]|nr:SAM-dependent methyltransferase [Nitrososphaerota archaeon]MDG7048265.1 SAM-dependent methyltransferase [Nitrososphaerota archaeon]MDG7051718.1 SAM-dependent methyltransferase [Nitrososphaerota archaeon]
MMEEYKISPIGYAQTDAPVKTIKEDPDTVTSKLIIKAEFVDGLVGLNGFSHIIILSFLTELRAFERNVMQIKMRRFTKYGFTLEELPLIGVFASDSPNRPNPIAISIARLLQIDKNVLTVKGLDIFNNTPILDIKPYTPERVVSGLSLPPWYENLISKIRGK